jgi:ABC-type multidrug transport system ATPase subunit
MRITLSDAGKRFNREWIFRHFNYSFNTGNAYAITGSNGSGKSTLLQVIAGAMEASEGSVTFNGKADPAGFSQLSICAPYLEVVEEMTATEFFSFHAIFKPFLKEFSPQRIIDRLELTDQAGKQIRYYSSGMKQRVKLGQAIFSDVPVVLLDEPCTNLDAAGIGLYHQLIDDYCRHRLVIVSSNDEQEYSFCREKIEMQSVKHAQR